MPLIGYQISGYSLSEGILTRQRSNNPQVKPIIRSVAVCSYFALNSISGNGAVSGLNLC